jgi:hypothetical protein
MPVPNITGGVVANLVENVYTFRCGQLDPRPPYLKMVQPDRQFQYDQGWGSFGSDFTFNGSEPTVNLLIPAMEEASAAAFHSPISCWAT